MPPADRRHRLIPSHRAVRRVALGLTAALLGLALGPVGSSGEPLPEAPDCHIFPNDNPWNQRVDGLPKAENSRAIIRSIGLDEGLHPDFGSGDWEGAPIGIPYNVVPRGQDRIPVSFRYAGESDPGPYPIPPDPEIEGGPDSSGDRHVIIVDKGRCKLFELFDAYPRDGGDRWDAGSGAIWRLDSNKLRPKGWTSADAAGLPILPGLARYSEVKHGRIDHALRFTVQNTRSAYVYPARHEASDDADADLPAMGQRVRLKKSFDISGFPRQARVVLKALKHYGMIVADNGSDWFISGAPAKGWNNDAIHSLGSVEGRNFVVIDPASSPRPD